MNLNSNWVKFVKSLLKNKIEIQMSLLRKEIEIRYFWLNVSIILFKLDIID